MGLLERMYGRLWYWHSDNVIPKHVPLGGRAIVKIYGGELMNGWSVILMEVGVGVGGCGCPCVNADPGDN